MIGMFGYLINLQEINMLSNSLYYTEYKAARDSQPVPGVDGSFWIGALWASVISVPVWLLAAWFVVSFIKGFF